jgi:hypothetical protein
MLLILQKVFAKVKLFKNQLVAILAKNRAKTTDFATGVLFYKTTRQRIIK